MTPPAQTPTSPPVRVDLRPRALELQRRRFWRELSFEGVVVAADSVTLALAFALLSLAPMTWWATQLGADGAAFLTGLIPVTPSSLARRVASLLLCLLITGAYRHADRAGMPTRMLGATVLGLGLPRWTELLGPWIGVRVLSLAAVVLVVWWAVVWQRRVLLRMLAPIDPHRLDPSRTLLMGSEEQLDRVMQGWPEETQTPHPAGTFTIRGEWPGATTAEGLTALYDRIDAAEADALVLVGPVSDAALQAVMVAGSSAGCRVFATRRRAFRGFNDPSFTLRRAEPLALLSRPALVGWQLVLKRGLDLLGATVGLVLLSPLLALLALLVRLTSPGPVLFRQLRLGLGGEPFVMFKFRTMVADAERRLETVRGANTYDDPRLFKAPSDPRLTPVGKFLRRSSLDELPQLWNVIAGEMSLVGPRPPLPSEAAHYQPHHYVRFEVLPGMTGPWQVGGRNAIRDFEQVIRMEADYIRGWTVWRDVGILLRTVPAVLRMEGAY